MRRISKMLPAANERDNGSRGICMTSNTRKNLNTNGHNNLSKNTINT